MESREYLEAKIKDCNEIILAAASEKDAYQKNLDVINEVERKAKEKAALKNNCTDVLKALDRYYCSNRSCEDCLYGTDAAIAVNVGEETTCIFAAFERIMKKILENA